MQFYLKEYAFDDVGGANPGRIPLFECIPLEREKAPVCCRCKSYIDDPEYFLVRDVNVFPGGEPGPRHICCPMPESGRKP